MGRGFRSFFCVITLLLCALPGGFAAPQAGTVEIPPLPVTRPIPEVLCQETQPTDTVDFSSYFSVPELKEDLVFVFYKTVIAMDDTVQAGYALLYGLQYAAAGAKANELLSVVIYFNNKKAKIYSIRKQAFTQLQNNKLKADELAQYMLVETRDTE